MVRMVVGSVGAYPCSDMTCKKRNRPHTQTHSNNNTTHDHTKDDPPHLTTIEGGAATVHTTSNLYSGTHMIYKRGVWVYTLCVFG